MSIPSQLPQFVTAARPGVLQALALQSGQVLDARIVGAGANGLTQVEIRGQLLNLMLPTPARAGETIRLEVQGAGTQLRLALLPATSPAATPPAQSIPATQVSVAVPQGNPAPAPPPGNAPVPPAATIARPVPQAVMQAPPQPVAMQTTIPSAPAPAAPPAVTASPSAAAPAVLASQAPIPAATAQPVVAQPAGMPVAPVPAATYPQAAMPAPPNPLAAAAAATATAPPQPAAPAAVAGPVRPVVATTVTANATAHAPPGNAAPQPSAPPPATPQSALAQMVQAAVPRQGSITALTTALSAIAGRVILPEPVARAAQQVLAGRVAIDGARFDGTALQAAMRGSGVFQEANLARGQGLLQPDMKSALLTLRNALTSWLGQQAPVAPVAQIPPRCAAASRGHAATRRRRSIRMRHRTRSAGNCSNAPNRRWPGCACTSMPPCPTRRAARRI
ncbi:hypothetical protein [Devosia ginsengisoli]|uniref:hypothetical protein n=1 Tax=Devosia ginsengisoli TaxID=400770 RepID=UPI0026F04810|nr:hypothetical protein [Devosia ginsengisoli]MCR6672747.1 hypothetical protein [Devosia ginsengisoli]